ncbi:MAG: 4Fe-4S binding protein [Chloroflexi bacterium]|nr:4Fe-4S binding protein [Chloroflexota bacterium]
MRLLAWQEVPPGAVIPHPGNSTEVETGSWRVQRPVVDYAACSHCMICWVFCPDSCFKVEDGKLVDVDYEHCKGCGICVVECPKRCIAMVDELLVGATQSAGGR